MHRSCIEHIIIDGQPAVAFDTGMDPRAFAKTRGAELLTQQGLEIRWTGKQGLLTSGKEGITAPSFSPGEMHPWLPEGSREIDGHLWIWGREVPGLPLEEYIAQGGKTALAAFVSYVRALRHIEALCPDRIKDMTILPPLVLVVPGEKVFFPPRALGERSLRSGVHDRRPEEILEQYQHPDLPDRTGLSFTVAVLAYRLWAGTFPFRFMAIPEKSRGKQKETLQHPTQTTEGAAPGMALSEWTAPQIDHAIHQIRADIRDGLFEPIHLAVPGIDGDLAQWIEGALTHSAIARSPGGKKAPNTPLRDIKERLGTAPGPTPSPNGGSEREELPVKKALPGQERDRAPSLEALLEILEKSHHHEPAAFIKPLTEKEQETLRKEKERYLRFQQQRIKGNRFLRRNRGLLIGGALSLVALALFIASFIRDQAQRPTTKGMSPAEVLTAYYTAFNTLDHERMSTCVEGKTGKEDITAVMNFYVISKVREAYEQKVLVLPPEVWMERGKPQGEFHVFGISDFSIDELQVEGNEAVGRVSYRFWYPERREDSAPLEGGPSSSKEEPAGQFNLHSTPLPPTRLETSWVRRQDRVFLTYLKDRWKITRIDRQVLETSSPEAQ
ncbi:hypothetical protein [Treponema sp. J25]|uniref:hypothetical protein n=1 Tax=Treponema sp. J25 TaxID=2094121 RepID=UPI00104B0A6C|nr:hypothetical protein [Treponema sp. J25]TCW62634.1 hypothetical protein C5O22_00845 [Treponema sp. J25]